MREVRIAPGFNDLMLATHGRALWILDDIGSLQNLPAAEAAGTYVFAPRTAYAYHTHSNDEGTYTRFAAKNPPSGAIVDFYQARAQAKAPVVEILDASGTVIRTVSGTHKEAKKDVPDVPNKDGINRYVWDLHENGPVLWMGAAKEDYRGPKEGAPVVPGTYTVRIVLAGKPLERTFEVKPDPRDSWTQADYLAGYHFSKKYLNDYSKIDTVLNNLDAMKKSLDAAAKAAAGAKVAQISAAQKSRDEVFALFTADYHNDEDSIGRPGALREDVPRTYGITPPTAAALDYAARFDADYAAAFARYNAFVDSVSPLAIAGATRVTP
jgi:hypothetical protein